MTIHRRCRGRKFPFIFLAVALSGLGLWRWTSITKEEPPPPRPWGSRHATGDDADEADGGDGEESSEFDQLRQLLRNAERICTSGEHIGVHLTYAICKESDNNNKFKLPWNNLTVVSVESGSLQFEEGIVHRTGDAKVYVLTANRSHLEHGDRGYGIVFVQPSRAMTSRPLLAKHAWMRELASLLGRVGSDREGTVHILKLGSLGSLPIQPWLVRSLMENQLLGNALQLILVITIDDHAEGSPHQWVRTLQDLKGAGFGLFYTKTSSTCNSQNCQFVTSWMKRADRDAVPALGADIREVDDSQVHNIQTLLTTVTAECNQRLNIPALQRRARPAVGDSLVFAKDFIAAIQWPICLEHLRPPCNVYCIKIGGSVVVEEMLAHLGCHVYVFDPSSDFHNTTSGPQQKIVTYSWGVDVANGKSIPGIYGKMAAEWDYKTPKEIVHELKHEGLTIDILYINDHGGEWNVLQAFTSAGMLKNIMQIVSTFHIWYGEEYFNLRDRSTRLNQLESLGFQVFFSEAMIDTSSAMTTGESHEDHTRSVSECCFVVGWIRTAEEPANS